MQTMDFDRYKWRLDEDHASRFKREVTGGELIEDVWNSANHGEQNLFLGVLASSSNPFNPKVLLDNVREAWKSLRWEVPTIAAKTMHVFQREGQNLPTTFLTYDAALSAAEVDEWASTTVQLETGFNNLDDLRYYLGQTPIPAQDLDPQTFLHILPFSIGRFGILLHTSHVPFDGSGIKILMTKLLTHLSRYLSDPKYPALQAKVMRWGTEGSRLLPAKTEVLALNKFDEKAGDAYNHRHFIEELPSGTEYKKTLGEVFNAIVTGAPRVHPFRSFVQPPFNPGLRKPKTRRLGYAFSEMESAQIRLAAKSSDATSKKLTINHIIHGALSLLPIFDNPPSDDSDAVIFYFGLINGRTRLREEYRGRMDYPGYCLGMSPIQIPVSDIQALEIHDHKASVLAVARMIEKEYRKQSSLPSLVAIEPQLIEMMLAGGPLLPFAGPSYSADGPGSLYLDAKYPDDGPVVLEITDFFLSLNKCDPGPFFRATEWNGRILLSVDFNELAVDKTVVQGWMDTWVELLLSLTI